MNTLTVISGLVLWSSLASPAAVNLKAAVHPENFNALIPPNVWIKPGALVTRSGLATTSNFHEEAPHYPWVIPENIYIKPGHAVAKNPVK